MKARVKGKSVLFTWNTDATGRGEFGLFQEISDRKLRRRQERHGAGGRAGRCFKQGGLGREQEAWSP